MCSGRPHLVLSSVILDPSTVFKASLPLESLPEGRTSQDPRDQNSQGNKGCTKGVDDIRLVLKVAVLVPDGTDQSVALIIQLAGARKAEKT